MQASLYGSFSLIGPAVFENLLVNEKRDWGNCNTLIVECVTLSADIELQFRKKNNKKMKIL